MLAGAYEFFSRVIIIHLGIIIADLCLKRWSPLYYKKLKLRTGISIGLFYVQWTTKALNRCVLKVGSRRSKFQKKWFKLGTWISLAILPLALYFILQSMMALGLNLFIQNIINPKNPVGRLTPYLDATIVGVNLPVSDIFYYVISLFTCVIIHELGHAFAAVREGLTIAGCGVSILLVFPIAFVHIEGLEKIPPARRLQVVCAGVWHNIVLASFAYAVVFLLPLLSSVFFEYGIGIQVASVKENSPIRGIGGLKFGDVITDVNNCQVVNQNTWIECVRKVAKQPTWGYCLTAEFIHENDETVRIRQQDNVIECCRNNTPSGMCFEYLERMDNPLELPQYSCLNVRSVVEESQNYCQSSENCGTLHCFRPLMAGKMKLFVFTRKNSNKALFLGLPTEVMNDVSISEYIPKYYFPAAIPNCIYKFLNFIIMFSGALAVVNLIPCFHFDGQLITDNLLCLYLRKEYDLKKESNLRFWLSLFPRAWISKSITTLGTCILVIYTFLAFITAFTI